MCLLSCVYIQVFIHVFMCTCNFLVSRTTLVYPFLAVPPTRETIMFRASSVGPDGACAVALGMTSLGGGYIVLEIKRNKHTNCCNKTPC